MACLRSRKALGFARGQSGSRIQTPGKEGNKTPARRPAPGLSCNPTVGTGMSLHFPDLVSVSGELGTVPAPPISFLIKARRPWNFGGARANPSHCAHTHLQPLLGIPNPEAQVPQQCEGRGGLWVQTPGPSSATLPVSGLQKQPRPPALQL